MKRTFVLFFLLCSVAVSAAQWAPAGDHIRTRWAAEVNPAAPLPEYPRPQMVRTDWKNLNGLWDYAITPAEAADFRSEGKILVPFAVESSLSGVGRTVGRDNVLWYERSFTVPSAWKGRNVLLNFGAVDWKAEIWVNSKLVGVHTGGYDPFSLDITSALKPGGKQTVRVRVTDATDKSFQPRGKQVTKPSGIWYTPVTGIWQTVWIEAVNRTHVDSYFTTIRDINDGCIEVNVSASGVEKGDVIVAELYEGKTGYSAEIPSCKLLASSEAEDGIAALKLESAQLWSPEHPYLYGLSISISRNGRLLDRVDGYAAFRTISKFTDSYSYRRLALNDKPIFMFGPLDQGWWPDGLYTAPTDEALHFDIRKTRQWGWNMIRKHIKVEPARWYYWCDVEGICVWQDMPSIDDSKNNKWSRDSFLGGTDAPVPAEWKANYYKEWGAIISALKVFPCIVVWVPFNEAWGQFDTPAAVRFTRSQDPTRLVDEASGGNFSLCGDIQDCHHYPHPMMKAFEGKLVNVVGEYGGIGYPVAGHCWQSDRNWGYGAVKENGDQVLKEYEAYAGMLKNLMRSGCSAAVYTQTTDVEIEVNGIMTYDREVVKVDEKKFKEINTSVMGQMAENDVKLFSYKEFRHPDDRQTSTIYTLRGGRLTMQLTTFGARIISLWAPDRNGRFDDVEIGYENLDRYINNTGERYLGSTVGPVANRIGGARFTLDGKEYNTPENDGENTLHGGEKGLDMQFWNVAEQGENYIVLTIDLPDGLDGFPGNRHLELRYELSESDEFIVSYKATTDKATPFNPSHHSFFNLTGRCNKDILGHVVCINASSITEADEHLIPTGRILSLDGSPLDFRVGKPVGKDIEADDRNLKNGGGYDHNWVLDRKTADEVEFAASVYEPESGRYMEVWTDQPGLQFYSGNFFDGKVCDKFGRPMIRRGSLAMEAQKFPDAVNHPDFPSTILRPGEVYTQKTVYRFGTR